MKTTHNTNTTATATATTDILVVLAPTVKLARIIRADLSVEAEYGEEVVEGLLYTAAHHGPRAGRPAPCVDPSIPTLQGGTILVSHLDLDTLGGIAAAFGPGVFDGVLDNFQAFWMLAAFVDTAGPHRLGEWAPEGVSDFTRQWAKDCLHAYWAWSQANRSPRPDPEKIHDVTGEVVRHLETLSHILWESREGERPFWQAGQEFQRAAEALNLSSFRRFNPRHGVVVRDAEVFVNHLYDTPHGDVGQAVLGFRTDTGALTLSFASPNDPRNAAWIMQEVFGPGAGGHKGIAGSPRGMVIHPSEKEEWVDKIIQVVERERLREAELAEAEQERVYS